MQHKREFEQASIAVIGGTGVYDPGLLENAERISIHTPYGVTSDNLLVGDYCGKRVVFLPRHGANHQYSPTTVPYRANIWALKQMGVQRIIAPCAVGSLRDDYAPGQIVFPTDFADFTKKRNYTFYEAENVVHIAMDKPFCQELRKIAVEAATAEGIDFHAEGTTITIEGPRYSTKAESNFYRKAVGADIIGMTLVPECQLAREMEICYLSIAAVTDYDAWHDEPVTAAKVLTTMEKNLKIVSKLLGAILPKIPETRGDACGCWNALDEASH